MVEEWGEEEKEQNNAIWLSDWCIWWLNWSCYLPRDLGQAFGYFPRLNSICSWPARRRICACYPGKKKKGTEDLWSISGIPVSQCSRQKLRTLKPTSFFQPLDLIWTFRWYSSQPVRINDTFPAHVHMFQVTTCRVLNIFGQINMYYSICCKTFKHLENI